MHDRAVTSRLSAVDDVTGLILIYTKQAFELFKQRHWQLQSQAGSSATLNYFFCVVLLV